MPGNFACFFFVVRAVVCRFFFKVSVLKKSFGNIVRVSNSLDPDQAQHVVEPGLGLNCLQRLSNLLDST